MRRIQIMEDSYQNSIQVYHKNGCFVTVFEEKDLHDVLYLPEAKRPGIYILFNYQGRRYVGQSARDIRSRLKSHGLSKLWWTHCVFFGFLHENLTKAQTDVLERSFIQKFQTESFILDNQTSGNISDINVFDMSRVDFLLDVVMPFVATTEVFHVQKQVRYELSLNDGRLIYDGLSARTAVLTLCSKASIDVSGLFVPLVWMFQDTDVLLSKQNPCSSYTNDKQPAIHFDSLGYVYDGGSDETYWLILLEDMISVLPQITYKQKG